MVSDHQMRVSDAEREAAATELREHYAAGADARGTQRTSRQDIRREDPCRPERADDRPSFGTVERGQRHERCSGRQDAGGNRAIWARRSLGPSGPFGPGGPYGSRGAGNDWRAGSGWSGGPVGRGIGAIVTSFVLLSALLLVGILGVFGIGTGRPIGIVLILAALALVRRLVFRRRVRSGRGCGRRRGW